MNPRLLDPFFFWSSPDYESGAQTRLGYPGYFFGQPHYIFILCFLKNISPSFAYMYSIASSRVLISSSLPTTFYCKLITNMGCHLSGLWLAEFFAPPVRTRILGIVNIVKKNILAFFSVIVTVDDLISCSSLHLSLYAFS